MGVWVLAGLTVQTGGHKVLPYMGLRDYRRGGPGALPAVEISHYHLQLPTVSYR
jgi:hypothetical protein